MKKALCIIIMFMLCFYTAYANNFELTIDTKTAKPGETISVDLTFANNTGLVGALFELEYDKERIELTEALDKKLLQGAVFSQTYDKYPYIMLWNSVSSKDFTNDGILATLTFKVKNDAKSGNAFIRITYNPENVFDAKLNNVDIHINNGAINIINENDTPDKDNNVSEDITTPDNNEPDSIPEETTSPEGNNTTSNPDRKHSSPVTNQIVTHNNTTPNEQAAQIEISFNDTKKGDWYYDAVAYVVENKLMNGVSDTQFKPDTPITRGMLVTILYRNEAEPAVEANAGFTDVSEDIYYNNAVNWAWQNKIVNGTTSTTFSPEIFITREQFAAIIYRYALYKNYDVTVEDTNLNIYSDISEISEYATVPLKYAVSKELINGKSATTLNPADTATRAEAAQILMRFLELHTN